MPTSDYHQISDVLHVVEQVKPSSVLDVGVGFGKWGFLCREILDVYYERVQPETWTTRIEGVEIFEPYRNPFWPILYNKIHMGNAIDVVPTLGTFDLVLCCDVIEHFDKPTGQRLLGHMLDHGRVVIVTSPRGHAPQGAIYGNLHETHLSSWGRADFDPYPHRYRDVGFTFMAVLSRDEQRIASLNLREPLEILGVKKGALELFKLGLRRLT